MTDIGGAIGVAQLAKLDGFNRRRLHNADYFDRHLKAKGLILPARRKDCAHVFHQYVVRVTKDCPLSREELMAALKEKGIGTAVHYPIPIHSQPVYRPTSGEARCPVADKLAGQVMSLPVHPQVTDENLNYICDTLNRMI